MCRSLRLSVERQAFVALGVQGEEKRKPDRVATCESWNLVVHIKASTVPLVNRRMVGQTPTTTVRRAVRRQTSLHNTKRSSIPSCRLFVRVAASVVETQMDPTMTPLDPQLPWRR